MWSSEVMRLFSYVFRSSEFFGGLDLVHLRAVTIRERTLRNHEDREQELSKKKSCGRERPQLYMNLLGESSSNGAAFAYSMARSSMENQRKVYMMQ